MISPPRPMPSVFTGLWEPNGGQEPGWASPCAGGEGMGGSGWDAAAPALGLAGLGSAPSSMRDPRRCGVRGACERIDLYIPTPPPGDAPRVLLPSLCLGTELSNPRTPTGWRGKKEINQCRRLSHFKAGRFWCFFFSLSSFRMAYLHEISNWRFFLEPGKCQQPVTPTQHSILSERPRSQSREANKYNNKGRGKKKKRKAESAEIRRYFPFCFPGVFQKPRQAGQQRAAGGFRAPFSGCTPRERSGWVTASRAGAGCSLLGQQRLRVPAPASPSPGLGPDACLPNPVSSPKHLGAAASSPGAPGLAARLARRGGNPQPKQVLAYDFQPAH